MSDHPTTRAELVEALVVERYARNDWWTVKPETAPLPALPKVAREDDEVTCASRRRALDREMRGAA